MPTYVYRCAKCGEQIEAFQTFSEAPLTKHAGCGGKLSKVLSAAGIVLKGSGFYKTDNRSGGSSKAPREKQKESASSDSGSSDSGSSSSSGSGASGNGSSKTSDSAAGSGSSGSGSSSKSGSSSGSEAKSA